MSEKRNEIVLTFIESNFPNGMVTPHALLEKARAPESPIHRYFEWDDSIAAENYRLYQARNLIRSVYVEINDEKVRKYVAPVYVEEIDANRYVDINVARRSPNLWEQVLERAFQEVNDWKKRYESYKELSPIMDAINKVGVELNGQKTDQGRTEPDRAVIDSNPTHKLQIRTHHA